MARPAPAPVGARRGNVVVAVPRHSLATLLTERMRRWLGVVVALVLLLGFFEAGVAIFPHTDPDAETRLFLMPPGAIGPGPSQVMPVFVMRDVGGAIRHGTAVVDEKGELAVTLFTSPLAEAAGATEALLFEPTLMSMWAVAPAESRAELRTRFLAVQDEVARTLSRVVGSSAFVDEYRPILREIMSDALETAWSDPASRDAFARLTALTTRMARYDLRVPLETLMLDRIETAVWDFVDTNWTWLATGPFGGQLDYTPLARIIEETVADPRFYDVVSDFAQRTMALDETRQLAERVAIVAVDDLMRDPRVADIAAAMYNDPRLREDVRPLTDSIVAMLAAVPRHLGGLGNENDLNPLAAHVFKAMTLNERVGFVMFVTPERYREIRGIAPDVAERLTEVGAADPSRHGALAASAQGG